MDLTQSDIQQLHGLANYFAYQQTPIFKAFINCDAKFKCLFYGNQTGKCLHEDSLISMGHGGLKELKDVVQGDSVVTIGDDLRLVPQKVLSVIDSGEQHTMSFKLRTGREVSVTKEHPFLTVDGWVYAENLSVGDKVATTRDKLLEIAAAFGDDKLQVLAESDVHWDKIVSIEDGGVVQTYDLEIEDTHNFIANGIVVHNTASVAYSYVMRFLGHHPVAKFNVDYYVCDDGHATSIPLIENMTCHCGKPVEMFYDPIRTFRFASESVPMASGDEEVKNTQYPELMKWLPADLIEKDLTARNPMLVIKDINGGPPIRVVFVGYHQTVQSQAGVQNKSFWGDEQSPPDVLEEQYPRLLASDGDMVFSLTAANRTSYMYDEYYMPARKYIRSPIVAEKYSLQEVEETASTKDIVVFQAATDDNPTLDPQAIDAIFSHIDDPDVLAIRRYGIFKQVMGRIFKKFEPRVHVVDYDQYFPDGLPDTFKDEFGRGMKPWLYARTLDYHEHVDWHAVWTALSPENEAFVWSEMRMSPERYTTREMAWEMCSKSKDHKYAVDRSDPLASKKQVNTGTSAMDDLNRYFYEFKRDGTGTGAYWQSWNTSSTRGRDEIRLRLNNSLIVGKPFNNKVVEDGTARFLPTLWICNTCPGVAQYMKMWRLEEWKERDSSATKDQKEKPQQKWSHYCMCLEALFKESAFRPMGITQKSMGRLDNRFRSRRHA